MGRPAIPTPPVQPGMKWCRGCDQAKPVEAFWEARNKPDGRSHPCIECCKARAEANKEVIYARAKELRLADLDARRAAHRIVSRKYRERHRERLAEERRARDISPEHKARYARAHNARNILKYHVDHGKIIKPDVCQACGGPGPIEGAHSDYDRPLDVLWLCLPCHRQWDAQSPKTVERVQN
jgi:hypothetical protein